MKKFNDVERNYIHLINSTDQNGRSIVDIFDNDLVGTILRVDKQKKSAEFLFEVYDPRFDDAESNRIMARIFDLHYKIVVLTNLISYLENNGLLTTYIPQPSTGNIIQFGQGDLESSMVSRAIQDPSIINLLLEYLDKKLLPSVELRELEKNGFRSEEERKFFKEQFAVWAGILLAIAFGLWGIMDSSTEKYQQQTVLEIRQLNDSLTKYLKQNISKDTIVVKLYKK